MYMSRGVTLKIILCISADGAKSVLWLYWQKRRSVSSKKTEYYALGNSTILRLLASKTTEYDALGNSTFSRLTFHFSEYM